MLFTSNTGNTEKEKEIIKAKGVEKNVAENKLF